MYAVIANSKKFGKMIVQWDPYYTPYSMMIHKVPDDTSSPAHDFFFHQEELDSIYKLFINDNQVHYKIVNSNLNGVTNDTYCIGCDFYLLETSERYYIDFTNKTIRNLTEEEEKEKAKEKDLDEAKRLINEFTIAEYEQESDFSDLHNVGLASGLRKAPPRSSTSWTPSRGPKSFATSSGQWSRTSPSLRSR